MKIYTISFYYLILVLLTLTYSNIYLLYFILATFLAYTMFVIKKSRSGINMIIESHNEIFTNINIFLLYILCSVNIFVLNKNVVIDILEILFSFGVTIMYILTSKNDDLRELANQYILFFLFLFSEMFFLLINQLLSILPFLYIFLIEFIEKKQRLLSITILSISLILISVSIADYFKVYYVYTLFINAVIYYISVNSQHHLANGQLDLDTIVEYLAIILLAITVIFSFIKI